MTGAPAGVELTLLRAALLPPPAGLAAWEEASHTLDLDQAGRRVQQLLPQVNENLLAMGVTPPARVTGAARRAWLEHQIRRSAWTGALSRLADEGVPTLLLKGGALIAAGFHRPRARPMNDLDVLVPLDRRDEAFAVLVATGWADAAPHRHEFKRRWGHAWNLRGPRTAVLDLHWRIRPEVPSFRGVWERSIDAELYGTPVQVPSPAHLLLNVCVHGMRRFTGPLWATDAFLLIRSGLVDWDDLVAVARATSCRLHLAEALSWLHEALDLEIPGGVQTGLRRASGPRERALAWARSRRGRLPALVQQYGHTGARRLVPFLLDQRRLRVRGSPPH